MDATTVNFDSLLLSWRFAPFVGTKPKQLQSETENGIVLGCGQFAVVQYTDHSVTFARGDSDILWHKEGDHDLSPEFMRREPGDDCE